MSFLDDIPLWLIVFIIAILLVILVAWWWLVWIIVGLLIEYFKLPGGLLMHIFLWVIITSIVGALGKVGTSKSQS